MKNNNITTEMIPEIQTDLICLVQQKHEKYKAEQKLETARKKNNKILAILIATGLTAGVIIGYTCIPVGAKAKAPTETTTPEETTETVTADVECLITDVVGDTITVTYNGELYSFYGYGYAEGQRVICTFTEAMEIINASEPIVEEQTTEIKFFDVPLSEDIQLHIFAECEKYNISPALVIAVIERESNYNTNAIGDNGNSLGLMQIQPRYHQWRMDELGGGEWLNAKDNVSVGIHILASLFNKYGDDIYSVLHEYNGGWAYANRLANKGVISEYALTVTARAEQLDNE